MLFYYYYYYYYDMFGGRVICDLVKHFVVVTSLRLIKDFTITIVETI